MSSRFTGPHFNAIVGRGIGAAPTLRERLKNERLTGGVDLGRFYPEFEGDQLFCFTEAAKKEQIDKLVDICTKG